MHKCKGLAISLAFSGGFAVLGYYLASELRSIYLAHGSESLIFTSMGGLVVLVLVFMQAAAVAGIVLGKTLCGSNRGFNIRYTLLSIMSGLTCSVLCLLLIGVLGFASGKYEAYIVFVTITAASSLGYEAVAWIKG